LRERSSGWKKKTSRRWCDGCAQLGIEKFAEFIADNRSSRDKETKPQCRRERNYLPALFHVHTTMMCAALYATMEQRQSMFRNCNFSVSLLAEVTEKANNFASTPMA
jgi:hypothetical protein